MTHLFCIKTAFFIVLQDTFINMNQIYYKPFRTFGNVKIMLLTKRHKSLLLCKLTRYEIGLTC